MERKDLGAQVNEMYDISEITDKIILGDCCEELSKIGDCVIDHVFTDPPFAIEFSGGNGSYARDNSKVLGGYVEIKREDYYDFSVNWLSEIYRVLKKEGTAFVVSGWTNVADVIKAAEEVGFVVLNHLIWKYQFGVFTKKKFVTSHYHILFLIKDKKNYKFIKSEHYPEDVFEIKREYWRGKIKTPNKLPAALFDKLLPFVTEVDDIILDPFMGSGSTGVAAKRMRRHFIGIEIVPEYVEFANERIRETTVQLDW